ncbi:MAG: restriction endonuclease [Elusimicrobia bacterium]|nr:restriction endonuclease [Candidatus Liberimonas magnetica]
MSEIQDVEKPNYRIDLSNAQILSKPLPPLKLLKVIDEDSFEEIVHEWAFGYLKTKYEKVYHLGGSGDKGRDIAAYSDYKNDIWDNYQCKHYDRKLGLPDILLEIGKLCYYCFNKELTIPNKYYFVSPLGVGTKAHDLLKKPEGLKQTLINDWDKNCKNKIKTDKKIDLDKNFRQYIDNFSFSIFDYIEPLEFVEQYKTTCYFTSRFGGFAKTRPLPQPAPQEIQDIESVYIRKILEAYSEYLKQDIENTKKLDAYPDLKNNFNRQREYFFCAESLKAFSRDINDPDFKHFENLKNEIYSGIINTIEEDAENGFVRLKKVLDRADALQITNNPLMSEVKLDDRKGICHHLANERDDIKWKK